jgi:nucleotidyltransferase/DNA polymerase involved in DNA repair
MPKRTPKDGTPSPHEQILQRAVDMNASDVHVVAGLPIFFRINGELFPQTQEDASPEFCVTFMRGLLGDEAWARFSADREIDASYQIASGARFRVNCAFEREQFTDEIEIYSIDEAFLQFSPSPTLLNDTQEIRRTVRRWTRIPVSIGIASTKTLAKIANHIAKKNPVYHGVFELKDEQINTYLAKLPASEVWGIGRQQTEFLRENGITTALQLKNAPDHWVKKNLSVVGLKIVSELRGISCLPLNTVPSPKKGIISSRSFGRAITTLNELEEAVALYTTRATSTYSVNRLYSKIVATTVC